jgi:mannitol/fructose-specific phosphotransferase system IIA component (Ntr-type)
MGLVDDSLILDRILPAMTTSESWAAVQALAETLRTDPGITRFENVIAGLKDRHDQDHLALGHGVWLPHLRTGEATELLCAVGRWKNGVKFSWCPEPLYFGVLVIAPLGKVNEYLRLVGMLARVFGDQQRFAQMRNAENATAMLAELSRE